MFSCFPAKLADLTVLPSRFTVELADSLALADAVSKRGAKGVADSLGATDFTTRAPGKSLHDGLSPTDAFSRTVRFVREFRESIGLADYVRRGRGIALADAFSASDRLSRVLAKSVRDEFLAEFVTSRRPGIQREERIMASEATARAVSKVSEDRLAVGDAMSKAVSLPLREELALGDVVSKSKPVVLIDRMGVKEVVQKVGFTLAAEFVPRVYFLPDQYKALWDIIEEEYHNAKVLACRRIYNYMLWVRRRVLGLKYPGDLRDAIGVRDYMVKRVTVTRRDRLEYDFGTEEVKG
jgi:hypothetical protein